MLDTVRRLVWFAIAGSLFTFAVLLVLGNVVQRQASMPATATLLRDEFSPGVHHLSGMVTVPDECSELSVRSETLTASTYKLLFETWQEPTVNCVSGETPRWIQTVVFTQDMPVRFVATIDGAALPIEIIPYSMRHDATTTAPATKTTKPGKAKKS
jgi:hypothetical protein